MFAACLALALHEGSHLLAMRFCRIGECAVEITPFGGMADARNLDKQPAGKRMLCAGAGVAGSAIAALACLAFSPRTFFWKEFFDANLMLALLNAIPAWPLDGARVAAACASFLGLEAAVRKMLSFLTMLLGACMVGLALCGIWHGIFNFSLLITGPYLWYAARAENYSFKLRCLHQSQDKLTSASFVPVLLLAGNERMCEQRFGTLLGRMEQDKYHLLLQIDSQSGKIQRLWTENEMRAHVFGDCQK